MVQKLHISYNQIHENLRDAVIRQPDIMIAIGGGGFIPARILRTFLHKRNNKNIPIQVL
jgi:hypoxanthine phosphoribosyltransferase